MFLCMVSCIDSEWVVIALKVMLANFEQLSLFSGPLPGNKSVQIHGITPVFTCFYIYIYAVPTRRSQMLNQFHQC